MSLCLIPGMTCCVSSFAYVQDRASTVCRILCKRVALLTRYLSTCYEAPSADDLAHSHAKCFVVLQVKLGIPGGDALRELAVGTIPLARIGTAEEAAGAILMLASPWSTYITGQVLEVNGGSYM